MSDDVETCTECGYQSRWAIRDGLCTDCRGSSPLAELAARLPFSQIAAWSMLPKSLIEACEEQQRHGTPWTPDMGYPPIRVRRMAPIECPNYPRCQHWLHDIADYDDPSPTCCTEGCTCGKADT